MASPTSSNPARPPQASTQPLVLGVVDIGASAIRLVVGQDVPGSHPEVLEEASRAVLLGRDTFSTGRISAATMDAAIRALTGFRALMNSYGVTRVRAVATSAVREAANAETFLDRVRVRTGLDVEMIDGSEESRLDVPGGERPARRPRGVRRRMRAARRGRWRQRGRDAARQRRARAGGRLPARRDPHAPAARQLARLARAAHPAAVGTGRERRGRHRGRDPGQRCRLRRGARRRHAFRGGAPRRRRRPARRPRDHPRPVPRVRGRCGQVRRRRPRGAVPAVAGAGGDAGAGNARVPGNRRADSGGEDRGPRRLAAETGCCSISQERARRTRPTSPPTCLRAPCRSAPATSTTRHTRRRWRASPPDCSICSLRSTRSAPATGCSSRSRPCSTTSASS